MFRLKLHLSAASLALLGLLLATDSVFAQGAGAGAAGAGGTGVGGPGGAPGAMPGSSMNGSQPGGPAARTGPGMSGYAPSYGTPGTGGFGVNAGSGMGGPAQPYWVPGGGGVGAAGFGTITNTFGSTGLGTPGRFGNAGSALFGLGGAGRGRNFGGANRFGRYYGHLSTGITLDPASRPTEQTGQDNVAHLRVILPSKDAELWVNDTPMKKKGTKRSFISPLLTPGKRFLYDLQVRWTDENGRVFERSRTVTVHAGSQDIVDFTRPESSQTVSRLGRELGLGRER